MIRWRARYEERGLAGLDDRERSGRPRELDHRQIVAETLMPPPQKLGVTLVALRVTPGRAGEGWGMAADVSSEQLLSTWGSGHLVWGASRTGEVVLRNAGPWRPGSSMSRGLPERAGLPSPPRVVGGGYSPDGRMAIAFVSGESPHPGAGPTIGWRAWVSCFGILHAVTASFTPWQPCGKTPGCTRIGQ